MYCMIRAQNSVYYRKFRHIQPYSCLIRYIQPYSRPIQPYYEHGVTLAYSEPCHIQNLDIFRIEDVVKTMSRHILLIQNTV